jgi:hypothetical protein
VGTRPCKSCRRTIEFATLPQGGSIPLERVQLYQIDKDGIAQKAGDGLISHFRTCKDADKFSRQNTTKAS